MPLSCCLHTQAFTAVNTACLGASPLRPFKERRFVASHDASHKEK